jgi:hypothetical protein
MAQRDRTSVGDDNQPANDGIPKRVLAAGRHAGGRFAGAGDDETAVGRTGRLIGDMASDQLGRIGCGYRSTKNLQEVAARPREGRAFGLVT